MEQSKLINKWKNSLASKLEKYSVKKYKDETYIALKKEIKEANAIYKKNKKLDQGEREKTLNSLNEKKKLLNEYKLTFEYNKKKNLRSIAYKDLARKGNSILFSFLTIGLLVWIIVYIFATGTGKLTLNKIFGDYKTQLIL